MNGCAQGLALIERLKATRKWAIQLNFASAHVYGIVLGFWVHKFNLMQYKP